MSKNNKVFCLFFLFSMVLFLFSKPLYADNGYLEYNSSCSNSWNNYPYEPNSSVNCINKRYCSDIKVGVVRAGGFDKCYIENNKCVGCNDGEECLETTLNGVNVFLKYTKTETKEDITDQNPCNVGTTYPEIQATNRLGNIEKSNKIVIKKEESNKCKITTKTPVIFNGIPIVVFDGNSVSEYKNYDKPAIFYNETGHNEKTEKDQNCLLKSCLDLTTEELEAIDYSRNFITKDGKLVYSPKEDDKDDDNIFFYKFCEPVKYTKQANIKGKKIKYRTNIKSNDESVYCHEFEDKDSLKYLWRYGVAYDSKKNYHCILHQCPIPDNATLTCKSNYSLFFEKSEDYKNNYKTYILKQPENFELKYANCTNLDECIDIPRLSTLLECKSNGTLNDDCDTYVGRDNKLKNIISDEEAQKLGLTQQTKCDENNKCIKTYDCYFKEENNYKDICIGENSNENDTDDLLSYFYRPVPPSPATEICPSNNNKTCEEGRTIIKRTLRGIVDHPLPENTDNTKKISFLGIFGKKKIYNKDNSRPKGKINYFKDNKVCASSDDDFKKFENYDEEIYAFGIKTTYHHGKYYDGFWRVTRAGQLPHILPLCDKPRLGIAGKGREYLCGNNGNICNTPSWDSYYIKGYPTYNWKNKEANVKNVSVTACLRQKNTGELRVCGSRECRVDCAFGLCALQWCGIDRCVTLTSNIGEGCSVDNVNNDCAKEVTNSLFGIGGSSVRFRLQALDRKVYVFLDVTSLGCISNKARTDGNFKNYNNPGSNESTIGGTFDDGRLNAFELYDDNSLTDNNCDGVINDQDVFGEYLYKNWNCKTLTNYVKASDKEKEDLTTPTLISNNEWCNKKNRPSNEVNLNCQAMMIVGSGNATGNIFNKDYITWDIVQYQGNNQNIDRINNPRDFCKVGQLDRCRGYFDKDGDFIKEQQAFILPIPTSPDFFYKYATIDNTPDLFLPLLNIFSVKKYDENDYTVLTSATDYDDLLLDFFNPSIVVKYGDRDIKIDGKTDDRLIIPFQKQEISGKIETTYGTKNEIISTGYLFKKMGSLYPEPSAKVCLYQILVEGKEQLVRCLNRKNPPISNFLIKPYQIDIKEPTVRAYFYKNNLNNSQTIDLTDETKFIPFYNNNNGLYNEKNKNLKASVFAYGQNYPILLESTYCSKLYYECLFYQKDYNEKVDSNLTTKEELNDLKNKIKLCDINVNLYCKTQNGNENLVLKTEGDNNYLIKVKENPNAIGAYNQICVTKGFEDYQTYVKAMPTKDNVVGKCVLTAESKQKQECRKKIYYEYCSTRGGDCVCLDGTNTCDCSDNSCVKKIDCSCNSENTCKLLPEGCFVSGFNLNNSVLDKNNKLTNSCICEETTSVSSGTTIRKSTPRESGLCVDLIDINFCESVKYYDKNGTYFDGGDGKYLSQIKSDYYSNIWRTNQKQLGKTYMGNFGHAEFEKATDCNGLPDDFCTLTKRCYSTAKATKGQICQYGEANCECNNLVQSGVCNGFWKNKYNTIPLARCNTLSDANGEKYGIFELIPGTSCERYSCPTISDENSPTMDEIIESVNATEESVSTINTEGKLNGFAAWNEYKKGTYAVSTENLEKDIENAYGDELEQREALHCLQGYGPAGSNVAIKNYIPLSRINSSNIINTGSISDIDIIIKNMLGYNLYVDNTESTISTKAYKSNNISELNNYNIFKNYYSAREYLPVRYCSQLGNWMGVDDIYNKYKVNPYYKSNSVLHNPNLTNDGFINNVTINKYNIPTSQKNTYNNSINYSKKYCERLFCQGIKTTDIGLLSIENSIPQNKLEYENLQNINYNVAYPNTAENNNYPKVANNPNDNRINTIYNNKYTYWRHASGATWSETPAPRKSDAVDVTGICYEKGGFYPHGVKFLPTFQAQYNTINFDKNEKDVKDYSFRNGIANEVNPTRTCNKWGLWSEVENKCQATCEAIDVFRTKFNDINNNNKLENFEITALYKNPKFRDDYLTSSNSVIKYGDKYTGGAKWPRSVAGTVVVGECDATVGKNSGYSGFSSNGIQFVRNGSDLKYQGAPYRECQEDGTWGPVQNPCINFTTCQDINIKNSNIYNSSNVNNNNNNIVSLSGGSILPKSNSYQTLFAVSTDCNTNPNYESGIIKKNCDITTGEWQSGFAENTCVLKSCGDVSYKIGDISIVDYKKGINNLYYPSDSGLKGQIGNYLGNNFTQQCPTGYYCNNCDNNKLTYTCSLNESNTPTWYRKGECVPYVCSFDSLNMSSLIPSSWNRTSVSNINKPNMNNRISGGNYYAKGGEENYNPSIYATGKTGTGNVELNTDKIYGTTQYATSGTVLEKSIGCKSGYYISDDKIKFTCNSTSITGPGTWTATVNAVCQEVKCPSFDKTIGNGTYQYQDGTGTCGDGTSSNVCPGAKYSLSCNSGYTKDRDKTWTCGTNGEWVSSGSGWCGKNCSNTQVTIKICTNGGNPSNGDACYFDYDPTGNCNLEGKEEYKNVSSGGLKHNESDCKSTEIKFVLHSGSNGGGPDRLCADDYKKVNYKVTCYNGKVSVSKCN